MSFGLQSSHERVPKAVANYRSGTLEHDPQKGKSVFRKNRFRDKALTAPRQDGNRRGSAIAIQRVQRRIFQRASQAKPPVERAGPDRGGSLPGIPQRRFPLVPPFERTVGHCKDDIADAVRLTRVCRRAQHRIDDRMAADQQRSSQRPQKQKEYDSNAPGLVARPGARARGSGACMPGCSAAACHEATAVPARLPARIWP